ncbi:MAG: ATP-binding protein [Butyricicoccus sp.]
MKVLKSEKFVSMLAAEHDSDMFPDGIYGALAYASENMEDMAHYLGIAEQGKNDEDWFYCPACNNTGFVNRNGMRELCFCVKYRLRGVIDRIKSSGVSPSWLEKQFGSFEAESDWQKAMLDTAVTYAEKETNDWLLICGQTGCGKTHITTAILTELIASGHRGKFLRWCDFVQRIPPAYFSESKFNDVFDKYASAGLLVLDDLFKKSRGGNVTEREFGISWNLIDRLYDGGSRVIISTEKSLDELFALDESLTGRIVERCNGNILEVQHGNGRNYRFRNIVPPVKERECAR